MRAYFFTNMYLSSIQNGIQPQHCTSELFIKYELTGGACPASYLYTWARDHKTTIVLNGGYSSTLRELIQRLDTRENPYPWTYFVEDEDAIGPLVPTPDKTGGALTSVCVVLPEKIYALASQLRAEERSRVGETESYIRRNGVWIPGTALSDNTDMSLELDISKWELEFAIELNNYGLAS